MFGSLKRPPARLGPWTDRQRPQCPGVWSRTLRHPLAARLFAVLTTSILAAAIAFFAGPPVTYRVGEIPAHDLRVRANFEVVNFPQTEMAREEFGTGQHALIVEKYPPGFPIVRAGRRITDGQLDLLRYENRAYRSSLTTADLVRRAAALLTVSLLLTFVIVLYVSR
ncbi:MAG TPA: hypothetical protein VH120_12835, partial [Gemmataceae bacterium]|nr:hypothetical protein [Gemmataceae bacterium]